MIISSYHQFKHTLKSSDFVKLMVEVLHNQREGHGELS